MTFQTMTGRWRWTSRSSSLRDLRLLGYGALFGHAGERHHKLRQFVSVDIWNATPGGYCLLKAGKALTEKFRSLSWQAAAASTRNAFL